MERFSRQTNGRFFFIGSISSENNKDEVYVNLQINNKIVKIKTRIKYAKSVTKNTR